MALWQDLRYAVRLMAKDRWFTLAAVTALSLGIAANATVFTLVNAVLLRGLPFPDARQIVAISTRDARNNQRGVSITDFEDLHASGTLFSDMALVFFASLNVSDDSGQPPDRFSGPYISSNIFRILGQQPMLGRNFTDEDDRPGAAPVMMLGYGIWMTRYGGDPSIVGKTLRVNSLPLTVVGVMPEDMKFPPNSDLWIPFSQLSPGLKDARRDARTLQAIGRMKPGVTVEQARAELGNIGKELARRFPDTNKDQTPWVVAFEEVQNGGPITLIFSSLMGAVVFVLLIACANVANLLLARSADRAREISVRVSLGATRWRVVRQLLVESVLLACLAGIAGFVLSIWGIRLFDAATQDVGKPYYMSFTLDPIVFAYLAGICLATGIVFGLAPALHVSRINVNDVLKEGGRSGGAGIRARRWTSALIVVEMTLTLVLLAGAGFMMRSFVNLYTMDLGLDTSNLATMALVMPDRKYHTPEERAAFVERADSRVNELPGIQAATIATNVPMGGGQGRGLEIEGRPAPSGQRPPIVTTVAVSPRYFETLGLKIANGRPLERTDGPAGHENVVVNQRFVALNFAQQDPIGQRIRLVVEGAPGPTPPWLTIVGVAPTVRQRNVQNTDPNPDPVVYLPYVMQPSQVPTLIVRSTAPTATTVSQLRGEFGVLDADMPLFNVRTMDEVLARQRWPFRVFGTMFAVFAVIALVLSGVGLYAVTAYSVTQRTQEIGVRMALGAQPQQVRWLIVRRSLIHLAIGLAIGLTSALGVGRLLRSLLVGLTPNDPFTLAGIASLLIGVSLAACYWPARRATRLDPVVALRHD
jgi:predicted permease